MFITKLTSFVRSVEKSIAINMIECVITLPCSDAWSATLYNSVGVVVARRSGESSEIVLPATSKGTHILVLNVGGRMVKKKVFVK